MSLLDRLCYASAEHPRATCALVCFLIIIVFKLDGVPGL